MWRHVEPCKVAAHPIADALLGEDLFRHDQGAVDEVLGAKRRGSGKVVVRRYQSAPSIGIRQLGCVVVVRAGGAHRDAEVDDAAR